MIVTIWERKQGDRWFHNHIEDGEPQANVPTPMCGYQAEAWKNGIWRRRRATLVDGFLTIHPSESESAVGENNGT